MPMNKIQTDPSQLRNTILERSATYTTIRQTFRVIEEDILDSIDLRNAHATLKKNISISYFDKFKKSMLEIEKAFSYSTENLSDERHTEALKKAIFAHRISIELNVFNSVLNFNQPKTSKIKEYQDNFTKACIHHKEKIKLSSSEQIFTNSENIEILLNSVYDSSSKEPYIAAKDAAIIFRAIEKPEDFGNWIPTLVEISPPQHFLPPTEICYPDGEGGEICEPLGATHEEPKDL